MPATNVWAKTITKSQGWLTDVAVELGGAEPHEAASALRCVLHALRDRLTPDEAVDLAGQMPLLIKGVFFDGWVPSKTPIRTRGLDEFLDLVERPLAGRSFDLGAEAVTRAVFRVLTDRVSAGEIRDVRGTLPEEVAALWPVEVASR